MKSNRDDDDDVDDDYDDELDDVVSALLVLSIVSLSLKKGQKEKGEKSEVDEYHHDKQIMSVLQSSSKGENSDVDENNDGQMMSLLQSPLLTVARIEQKEQELHTCDDESFLDEYHPTVTMVIALSSGIDSKEEEKQQQQPSMQLQQQQLTVCLICIQKEKEKEDLYKVITKLESQKVESDKRLATSRNGRDELKTEITDLKTEITDLKTNDARLNSKITNLTVRMESQEAKLNDVIVQLETSISIFSTGRGMFLRLLIYDAHNFIVQTLNRPVEVIKSSSGSKR